jgi:hypothetical protein
MPKHTDAWLANPYYRITGLTIRILDKFYGECSIDGITEFCDLIRVRLTRNSLVRDLGTRRDDDVHAPSNQSTF